MKKRESFPTAAFWRELSMAPHRLLGLDYDGTLAPFRMRRMEAIPLEGVPKLVEDLSRLPETTVAVVSGRPIGEILLLLGGFPGFIAGSHGFELRSPGGKVETCPPAPRQDRGLVRAREAAVQMGFGERLETKIASVAFHTRGAAPEKARDMERLLYGAWTRIGRRFRLSCRHFNGGVEIRARGRDKGTVLHLILSFLPAGTLPVYIGDDDTDEDAFRTLRDTGFGIRMGTPDTDTAARAFLADAVAVKGFLEEWIRRMKNDEPVKS